MDSADEKPSPTVEKPPPAVASSAATAALTAQKVVQQQVIMPNQQQHPTASSSAAAASLGTASLPQYHVSAPHHNVPGSKYQQLLLFIDELGRVIRPTYNANRSAQERLKRDIVQARLLVRECMAELEQQRKQQQQQQQPPPASQQQT